ncbi:DNA alkylation repair protein [Pontivivens insulae]|uniref:DNA alkylation repair enzyme n=1 Tax=Pontivivens insulae TaxID=1639689 RepID=A0A2R8ACD0_9RHOB|nr:DNA alkylation repair protein [Pontivivens insulae]RED13807.1 3-methyladenine DNA glycosylase AlkD [Pontivivens insulae]SPF29881.1 hypothetical protein POI8812_02205 [Pontivivens insulae]
MTTSATAIEELRAAGDSARAEEMAAYHKADRPYLGLANGDVEAMCRRWREGLDRDGRVALAIGLWDSNIFEARIAAGKVLVQARIKPDDAPVWDAIKQFALEFDSWAIADAVAKAAERRIAADLTRFDELADWAEAENMWMRRATLVFTLPWAKGRNPSPEEAARREQALGWAAHYTTDPEWFMQKAVSWWLRTLSRHDPERVHAFVAAHGEAMKPFAQKDALRLIT